MATLKVSALINEFFGALKSVGKPRRPLPYTQWDKDFLENYVGLALIPLPPGLQKYIDGQDEFTELEHDAIELAVEKHFKIPKGYAAAFCAFTPVPRDVAFIRWENRDQINARKSRV